MGDSVFIMFTKERKMVTEPVEVMTGLIFACLDKASMHSSLLMLNIKHSSIRWCTCIYIYIFTHTYTHTHDSDRI